VVAVELSRLALQGWPRSRPARWNKRKTGDKGIDGRFKASEPSDPNLFSAPRYNIAPTQSVAAVQTGDELLSERTASA
jgi:hypothetical protein